MANIVTNQNGLNILTRRKLPDGSDNPFFDDLIVLVSTLGNFNSTGDKRTSPTITDFGTFGVLQVAGLMQLSAALSLQLDVVNYPTFITLSPSQLSQQVPAYLPDRIFVDANKVEQVHNWQSYLVQTHDLTPIDENGTVQAQLDGAKSIEHLPASVFVQLIGEGFNVQGMSAWVKPPEPVE